MRPRSSASHPLHPRSLRHGFETIAGKYDLMNDLMTFGIHRHWKRRLVEWLDLQPGDVVLDLCAGTGDLAYLCCEATDDGYVVALDFTEVMLHLARNRRGWCVIPSARQRLGLVQADTLRLPFRDSVFTAVSIGYGLRNLVDMRGGLVEIVRVLRPAGRLAILDTSRPPSRFLAGLHRIYLLWYIPLLARVVLGSADMYRYLVSSALSFLSLEEVESHCMEAGLDVVRSEQFGLGSSMGLLAIKR